MTALVSWPELWLGIIGLFVVLTLGEAVWIVVRRVRRLIEELRYQVWQARHEAALAKYRHAQKYGYTLMRDEAVRELRDLLRAG